jgi:hypothetical protein
LTFDVENRKRILNQMIDTVPERKILTFDTFEDVDGRLMTPMSHSVRNKFDTSFSSVQTEKLLTTILKVDLFKAKSQYFPVHFSSISKATRCFLFFSLRTYYRAE